MRTDLEVIDEAMEILSDDKTWNKGDWCSFTPEGDVTYCAEGAVIEAAHEGVFSIALNTEYPDWSPELATAPASIEKDCVYDYLTNTEQIQVERLLRRLAGIYFEQLDPDECREWHAKNGHELPDDLTVYLFNDAEFVSREDIMLGFKTLREELTNEAQK